MRMRQITFVLLALSLLPMSSVFKNRFESFSPVRNNCEAKWFVDGQDYMSAVAGAIEAASREIFIADWQISPHLFMKRPDTGVDSLDWRLDKLLLKKADQGIMIYILLYSESKKIAGMDLGSDLAQSVLKHKKIEVLLHPDANTMLWYGSKGTGLWSHHEKIVIVDQSLAFVGGIDLCFGRWDTHNHELTDNYPIHPCVNEEEHECTNASTKEGVTQTSVKYARWIGKDYGNTFQGGVRSQLDRPMEDYIERSRVPRMPWHDVGCAFTGAPAHDIAKHFIQRYNSIKKPYSWNVFSSNPQQQLLVADAGQSHETSNKIVNPSAYNLMVQVLRSVDKWSAEQILESSIHEAYLYAIRNAKHFIYIENQFFISSQPGVFLKVENQILSALADRILLAYQNQDDFHIAVVMPLKPEFPGEWGEASGKDMESVSYWNYLSLYSGNDSLYSRLEQGGIPKFRIQDYFSVYGLRTHALLDDKLVTEIVYVHSKLMIVDDQMAIIGSANINDRSMLGSRDSEIAVLMEDTEMLDSKMNGQGFRVGKFSHGLRCHLMREHLGLLGENYESSELSVEDPLANNLMQRISKIASENEVIYNRVFGGKIDPTNHVWNLDQLKEWRSTPGIAEKFPDLSFEELKKVQGRLVTYPVLFLKDVLKPSYLDVLGMYVDNRRTKYDIDAETFIV